MSDLTYDELHAQLAAACKARRWRSPSPKRLKKLRDTGQLPKAIPFYEKGRRGRSWLYPESTVAAYVRAEELRRASGKRVRSWKQAAQREKASVLRDWLAQPDDEVPREVIASELEGFAGILRQFAPDLYSYIEHPVGPLEDERVEGAHTAIEAVLDASTLREGNRAAGEAVLQMLIFRGEDGKAEDFDLSELLAPMKQRAGPFAALGGIPGLRGLVCEVPANELLTHPSELLASVGDQEFRDAVRMTTALFSAIERVANVAKRVMEVVEKARSDERLRGDVRIDWCRPIVDGSTAITRFLQSDLAPTLLCTCALANVFLIRNNPNTIANGAMVTSSIANFASIVERSKITKKKTPALNA